MKDAGKAVIAIGVAGAVGAGIWLSTRKVEAAPENILLSGLIISPAEIYIGEPVEINVIATNIGEVKATKEVICEVL